MVAKVMIKSGYQSGKSLGKDERGRANLIELHENKDKFVLGYKPTKEDQRRIVSKKEGENIGELENRQHKVEAVPICDIRQSFQNVGLIFTK